LLQVPCTGGTTTHILEAIGNERLAFKVKLKHKYYNLYKVSPPLGFVKPGVKKELILRRLPGKPGKTKLVVEYIASPEGYDPRKPFVEGAEVGALNLHVRAYSDKKLPDKKPRIMGKLVTKTGQKFTPALDYDDLKIEKEIDQLYREKDKDKSASTQQTLKEKEAKEKVEKEGAGKEESNSSTDDDEKKNGKVCMIILKCIFIGKKKTVNDSVPIQVVVPNVWKDMNVGQMQKSNDELKTVLEVLTNENKRLEEVIKQMMQEITFLRESLLSTVMKLATAAGTGKAATADASPGGGQAALTALTGTSGNSGSTVSADGGSGTSDGIKTSSSARSNDGAGTAHSASITSPTAKVKSSTPNAVADAKSPTSAGSALSETGAGAEVEKYLSAMLAGGGPTDGAKRSDDGIKLPGGGVKEFSLFSGPSGGGGGVSSAYMNSSSPSAAKTKDLRFAFGTTADQLDSGGRPYSPSRDSSGSFGSGGSGSSVAHRSSSVYL
uniref:Major sperm protein n=1 Tax=Elaeophora elaphi TaxID=1147741 RepID=A0A0R3S4K5_9BILA